MSNTPPAALTKHDIAEYYSDPAVRASILAQIKNKPVMTVQTLPKGDVLRRNDSAGKPLRILQALNDAGNPQDLAWYTGRRYSEFHPTIGRKTRSVWVDIDPGPDSDFEAVKPVVAEVENALKKVPGVKDTRINYSGGRGFHIRGNLRRKSDTDAMRKSIDAHLRTLDIPNAVFKKPKGKEIRLDTSTLKNKGSIRAAYSLNSETGRVAVPLTQRELRGFQPEQADLNRILREKEFAPGISRSKRVYALPEKKDGKQWAMAVQEHNARRAGKHWDLRLVDPETGFAHSWAVPKAQLPEGNQKLLAVRTPTHTAHYALNFGAKEKQDIGKGYGKGTVQIVHKEPVKIVKSEKNKLQFDRIMGDDKERLVLFRTKGDNWLLRRKSLDSVKESSAMATLYQQGFHTALEKLGMGVKHTRPTTEPAPSETDDPLVTQDDNLPAGQLAKLMVTMDTPDYSARKKNIASGGRVEDSVDRDVQWGSPQDVSSEMMAGASPIIPGGGL